MSVAAEYRRRQGRGNGGVVGLIAVGLGVICAGGLVAGLLLVRDSGGQSGVGSLLEDPHSTARAMSDEALRRRGIVDVQAEGIVTEYGGRVYLVTGTCLVDGTPAIYSTTIARSENQWTAKKVLINGSEVRHVATKTD